MEKLKTEKTIPICWEEWDDLNGGSTKFYTVIFTENFGPFTKDQKFDFVVVDFFDGILQAYNVGAHAEEVIECKIRFVATEKYFDA